MMTLVFTPGVRRTMPSSHRFAKPITNGIAGPCSGKEEISKEVTVSESRTSGEVSPSKIRP